MVSAFFRKALEAPRDKRREFTGNWVLVGTVRKNDPLLYTFMGYSGEKTLKVLNSLPHENKLSFFSDILENKTISAI